MSATVALGLGLTDAALARRVEAGWSAAGDDSARSYGRAHPEAGVAVEAVGGGSASYFGVGSPLSQAQGLGLDGPVSDAELDRLAAFFTTRGAPAAVEVASLADPGLLPALSRRGYLVAEQTHVLARPLGPADRAGPAGPAGAVAVAVARVDGDSGPDDRDAWLAAVLGGFFEGPGAPPLTVAGAMEAMTSSAGATGWLARVDGAPAGGAALVAWEGLALFAGDATLPDFRRRGVQSALIRARLGAAAGLGADLAAVCTAPGGASQRNYERAGFRVVYARTLVVRDP